MSDSRSLFTSLLTTQLRGFTGINSKPAAEKPKQLLQLFDMENCPYCRLVREALTELDLDAMIYPCPKQGTRFRPAVLERGGISQFPYLIDPNTGVALYESLEIISYLYSTYGQRGLPLKWRLGQLQKPSSILASACRVPDNGAKIAANLPEQPLELYSFEGSPYARPVRELLCRMEINYILRSCGRSKLEEWLLPPVRAALGVVPKSELHNRKALLEKEGRMSIPYLYDPNTGRGMFESGDIIDYLHEEYGA